MTRSANRRSRRVRTSSPLSRRRRRPAAVLALAAVVAAAGAAAFGIGVRGGEPPRREVASPATAEVVRETLVDYEEVAGELGFGEVVALRYAGRPETAIPAPENGPATPAPENGPATPTPESAPPTSSPPPETGLGLVTWLPAIGSVVGRGEPLFRVDDQPVPMLLGELPLYRTLAPGVTGSDVRQLEENLSALGYTGFTVDEAFTGYTADAVRRWQHSLGVSETGTIAPGALVYATGEIRVDAHTLRVGDEATGEIFGYTGTVPKVTALLPVSEQRYAVEGTEAAVTLPDGSTVAGTVERIDETPAGAGDAAAAGLSGDEPMVEVTIGFQDAVDGQQAGPVGVRFVAQQREDVLTVPVVALVALVQGGYGVEVLEGATTRSVAVETGMFARGRVEITAGDLRPGMAVVVPR
jgi:peptidoglycan hydrolase-like protein with peptidoglycan-binding domain